MALEYASMRNISRIRPGGRGRHTDPPVSHGCAILMSFIRVVLRWHHNLPNHSTANPWSSWLTQILYHHSIWTAELQRYNVAMFAMQFSLCPPCLGMHRPIWTIIVQWPIASKKSSDATCTTWICVRFTITIRDGSVWRMFIPYRTRRCMNYFHLGSGPFFLLSYSSSIHRLQNFHPPNQLMVFRWPTFQADFFNCPVDRNRIRSVDVRNISFISGSTPPLIGPFDLSNRTMKSQ